MILRGSDDKILFTLSDSNGNTIDLTTFTGIIAILTTDERDVLQRYSREAYTDPSGNVFNTGDFVQAPNQLTNKGEFTLNVQSTVTKIAPLGKFFVEIKTQTTDADFTDGTFDSPVKVDTDTNGNRFEFTDAITKNDFNYG